MFEITKGVIASAQKVVIYGPEGVGKSSMAAAFPNPLFIDTEGSTKNMNVARLPKPTSWQMLNQQIDYIKQHPELCQSLIVDTVDWAEAMCIEHVCATHRKKGIEEFGYGTGYVYAKEELGRFLNKLEDVVDVGINVVLTAHSQIRKFEQPDEMGAYDRYELKLGKKTSSQTAPLVKEWADMVLFCNYKTFAVATDDKGNKHKAQGGQRVMYTNHHPAWDAKNRHGLPDELPLDYQAIAHIFNKSITQVGQSIQQTNVEQSSENQAQIQASVDSPTQTMPPVKQAHQAIDGMQVGNDDSVPLDLPPKHLSSYIDPALKALMDADGITEQEVMNAVSAKGYYPQGTLIENYEPQFIQGALIAAWPQVKEFILKDIPF